MRDPAILVNGILHLIRCGSYIRPAEEIALWQDGRYFVDPVGRVVDRDRFEKLGIEFDGQHGIHGRTSSRQSGLRSHFTLF